MKVRWIFPASSLFLALLLASTPPSRAQRAFGDDGALIVAPPRGGAGPAYPIEDDRILALYSYSDPEGFIGLYLQTFDSNLDPVLEGEGRLLSPAGENWYLASVCAADGGVVTALRDTDQQGRCRLTLNRWDGAGAPQWNDAPEFEFVRYAGREYLFQSAGDDVILVFPDAAGEDAWRLFRLNPDGSFDEDWPDDGLRFPMNRYSYNFLPAGDDLWLVSGNEYNRLLPDGSLLFDEPRPLDIPDAVYPIPDDGVHIFIPRPDGMLYAAYVDTADRRHCAALIDLDGEVLSTYPFYSSEADTGWGFRPTGPFAFGADPQGRLYIALYADDEEFWPSNRMLLLDPEADEPLVWGEEGVEFESPGFDGRAYSPRLAASEEMAVLTFFYAAGDMPPRGGEAVFGFNAEGERLRFVENLPLGMLTLDEQGRFISVAGGLENYSIWKFDSDGIIAEATDRFRALRSAVTYLDLLVKPAGGVRAVWVDRKHGLTVQELDGEGEQQREPRGEVVRPRRDGEAYLMGQFSVMLGQTMLTMRAPVVYDLLGELVGYSLDGAGITAFNADCEVEWEYEFPDSLAEEWLSGALSLFTASGDWMALVSCYNGLFICVDRDGLRWIQRVMPADRNDWPPFVAAPLPGLGWGMVKIANDTLHLFVLDYEGEIAQNFATTPAEWGGFSAAFEGENIVFTGHFTRGRGFTVKKWHFSAGGRFLGEYENTAFTPDTIWGGNHRRSVASAGASWVLQYNPRDRRSALQLLNSRAERAFGDGGYLRFFANNLHPDGAGGIWLIRHESNYPVRVMHLNGRGEPAHRGWGHNGVVAFAHPVQYISQRPGRDGGELLLGAYSNGRYRAQLIRDDLVSAPLEEAHAPRLFALHPAYPNPFNSRTFIRYELPHAEAVQVDLIDPSGRLVRRLFSGHAAAGGHQISIDGANLTSGIYFVRLKSASEIRRQKILLVR